MQHVAFERLGFVEYGVILFDALGRGVSFVRAYAVIHRLFVEVGYDVAYLKAIAAQYVLYAELVFIREASVFGCLAREQEYGARVGGAFQFKFAQFGKAVLGHVISLAAEQVLIVA